MRVVVRVERVDGREPQPLEFVRDVLAVVDVLGANCFRGRLRIADEAVRRVRERAGLPWVVRGLRGEYDVRALRLKCLARLNLVEDESVHGLARGWADARLLAVTEAVGASVVGRAERAAVVVPKLDDDNIAWLDDVDDRLEAALVRVRARGAAPDRVVDDCRAAERLLEVLAPSCASREQRWSRREGRKIAYYEHASLLGARTAHRRCQYPHHHHLQPWLSRRQGRPSALPA